MVISDIVWIWYGDIWFMVIHMVIFANTYFTISDLVWYMGMGQNLLMTTFWGIAIHSAAIVGYLGYKVFNPEFHVRKNFWLWFKFRERPCQTCVSVGRIPFGKPTVCYRKWWFYLLKMVMFQSYLTRGFSDDDNHHIFGFCKTNPNKCCRKRTVVLETAKLRVVQNGTTDFTDSQS